MAYRILLSHRFEKEFARLAKKFPSLKNEFSTLVDEILKVPHKGTVIGNNCYKIRLAINSKGRGKSGGARLITYLSFQTETVYLLTIYDKSEQVNLKANDLKDIINSLKFD